ncbi:MAG: hypothetical protein Q9220_006973 [cf. Caloplaca sp. 1 TL-2023]
MSAASASVSMQAASAAAQVISSADRLFQRDLYAPLGSFRHPHPHVVPMGTTRVTSRGPASSSTTSHQQHHSNVQGRIPKQPRQQPAPSNSDIRAGTLRVKPQAAASHAPTKPKPLASSPQKREVHFATPFESRTHNSLTAEKAARLRALDNELEVQSYIDRDTIHHRRPRPPPVPAKIPSDITPIHSRSSSAASTIDTLTTTGAPIPASPSRNPGFKQPRQTVPAFTKHATQGERELSCEGCFSHRVQVKKNGIWVCFACFGEDAAVAQKRKGRK